MLRVLVLAVLALQLALENAAARAQEALLDGKVFIVDIGDKGRPADNIGDVLTFRDGTFHSSACNEWGYGPGSYRSVRNGSRIQFDAESVSANDGRLVWRGVIEGGFAEGTQTYYRKPSFFRPNPAPTERWFKSSSR
jgi:hypothetical protein